MIRLHTLIPCAWMVVATLPAPAATGSIVPPAAQLGDAAARLELARILSWIPGREAESLDVYDQILAATPDEQAARSERLALLLRLNREAEAEQELQRLLADNPNDPALLAGLGALRARQGRAAAARDAYQSALASAPATLRPGLELRLARDMRGWGDFYRSEAILERHLRDHPSDQDARLDLIGVWRASQRFEWAEGGYRSFLLDHPGHRAALLGLAETKISEKEFEAARKALDPLLADPPGDPDALALMRLIPGTPAPLKSPPQAGAHTPTELHAEAGRLASTGDFAAGIERCRRALAADPDYFPARMTLGELLAAARRFDEAIPHLEAMDRDFPDHFKILLTLARAQSWARDYGASIRTYQRLIALNPKDYVPRREMARVAGWNKDIGLAQATYATLWTEPVDGDLARHPGVPDGIKSSIRPFARFDAWLADAPDPRVCWALWGKYRVQKAAWLESRAKWQAHQLRFQQAEDTFQELVRFVPGNQEAWFDLAQVQANQGLHRRAVQSYHQLIAIEPLHSLAGRALEREAILARPAARLSWQHWDEEGRGGLSDTARNRIRAGFTAPIKHDFQLSAWQDTWIERPGRGPGTRHAFTALGSSIEASGIVDEWFRFSAGLTGKDYLDPQFDDTFTGHARIGLNVHDHLQATLGYAREDVIPNRFALDQGIQSDNIEIGLNTPLTRRLEIETRTVLSRMTDNNEGIHVQVTPSWLLIDHPTTLKFKIIGDYRHHRTESEFILSGTEVTDIIHPYWSPQDFFRGQLALEWRHDLSREFYNAAQLHYYALRLRGGSDTTDNDGIAGEAEWHIEFCDRWTFECRGMIERSAQWEGESFWLMTQCRF